MTTPTHKYVLDGPMKEVELRMSALETSNAILVERIIKLEDLIKKLEAIITDGEKEILDLKSLFSDNFRTRNMIIRSYSKNGLISKFMPD